ncbi:MAG: hypothetical protein ACI9XZ_003066 [Alphaproteobacteria bacterium]|jgi:hypothetical protein
MARALERVRFKWNRSQALEGRSSSALSRLFLATARACKGVAQRAGSRALPLRASI